MHLDWYDRQILIFVLEWAPFSGTPDEESFIRFGIDARRVMRRFDAVVEVFAEHTGFTLADSDLELVRRAAHCRRHRDPRLADTAAGSQH